MILGIDAHCIRGKGGNLTYLVGLLRAANPSMHGFDEVVVWSGKATLDRLPNPPWLRKVHEPLLDKSLPFRIFWQVSQLARRATAASCDILLVPGCPYAATFRPFVSMSTNMLPFEWSEMRRYGVSWMLVRLLMLRIAQSRTFYQSNGLICLTRYAQASVTKGFGSTRVSIVPHGVDDRFFHSPREQHDIRLYSRDRPFRILYVSRLEPYKHQWHVAEAVAQLHAAGLPVALELIGSAYHPALKKLRSTLHRIDPTGMFIHYRGEVPHAELHRVYHEADLFVFASSCENLPNILIESMASGLPIACSNRGPMPEVLGEAGEYFEPDDGNDIARAILRLVESPSFRTKSAHAAFELAKSFSWRRCASETFGFLAEVSHFAEKAEKEKRNGRNVRVLLMSPLPPPEGGIASWTQRVLMSDAFKGISLIHVDTSLGGGHYSVGGPVLSRVIRSAVPVPKFVWACVRWRPQVVHLTISGFPGYYRDMVYICVAILLRRKVLLNLRFGDEDAFSQGVPRLLRPFVRASLRASWCVVPITQPMVNATRSLGCCNVEKIPNCIDIRDESDVMISAAQNNCLRVLYVGWVIPSKGVKELLEAMVQVDGASLTIVGPIIPQLSSGNSQWIHQIIEELHLEEQVHLVGRLETEAVRQLYRQYDVLVMPSFRNKEAFPNVVLEAMEASIPVVAFRVNAMLEIVRDGTDGFLIDGGDVGMLADRLRWLKNNPKERRRMGRSARERVTNLYSVERVTGLWVDLYKRAVDSD